MKLASSNATLDRAQAAANVKAWARERFGLPADVTILVSEVESGVPGFPALQTVLAFWTVERKHYHWTIFKPLEEVAENDLPPAWYKDALLVASGAQCSCC